MLTLGVILEALTGIKYSQSSQIISEASIDTRNMLPGSLFVALPGENVDGHYFVQEAFNKGAHVVLIEKDISTEYPILNVRSGSLDQSLITDHRQICIRVDNTLSALQQIASFWRRQINVRVVGITGSVGKSTTKELVSSVLSQNYRVLKNKGNLNNEIGLPLTLLNLTKAHQFAVLEMGFYVPGEISLLCEIAKPHTGVVTNVGTVHAERAGTQKVIAQGKAELVKSLPPAPEGTAVLNYDDPFVREMASQTRARVFFYGLESKAHLWADEIKGLGLEGIRFHLHYRDESFHVKLPLIGRHSVHTALRAAAVGLIEGLSWQEIILGLQKSNTQLRLVAVHTENGALILDDTYNASPESMIAALNLLSEMDGKKIAVLGEMLELGQYEEQGHQRVGMRAAQVCDRLVLVGSLSKIIGESARDSGMPPEKICWFSNVEEVTAYLRESITANDVVLIKGSHGMRMDRIVSAMEMQE